VIRLLLSLINNMAVVLVVAYLITRAPWFERTLGGKVGPREQLEIGLIFGLLGTYGTLSGASVMHAVATTRYIGPLIGGLLGGPLAGLGAGLIAGGHELIFGNDLSKLPSVVSTLAAGLAGGAFHYRTTRRTGKQLQVVGATVFAMLVQILHQILVLLLLRPFSTAVALVEAMAIPMRDRHLLLFPPQPDQGTEPPAAAGPVPGAEAEDGKGAFHGQGHPDGHGAQDVPGPYAGVA
jgi:LytS/YehU family sensor histidine kinase